MTRALLSPRGHAGRPRTQGIFSVSLATLALTLWVALAQSATAQNMPASVADLVEEVTPAVVTVSVLQRAPGERAEGGEAMPLPSDPRLREFFKRFFDEEDLDRHLAPQDDSGRRTSGVGSGFILDPAGYVVTNNHVVAEAEEIKVTLKDGESFEATLIGRDEKTDLALLKVDAKRPLPSVRFGDSDRVRVGDWVMAVGNPFGLGGTVTTGIVSARGRDLAGGTLIDFLQIDAAINQGNSGGPAFNARGEVVGINTAIFSPNGGSVGIGFAIPSNLAEQIIADLREDGRVERGWLGVRIQPVTPELAEGLNLDRPRGALIAAVEPGGPADQAGLEPGDVVLAWGGKPIDRLKDLPRLVALTPSGDRTAVTVWRKDKEESFTVVTGRLPEEGRVAALPAEPRAPSGITEVPGTGLAVATLTPELRQRFGIAEPVEGVVVVAISDYSAAAEQGIRPGDVIGSIALEPVSTAGEAVARVEAMREGGEAVVTMMVYRAGIESFVALRLADA